MQKELQLLLLTEESRAMLDKSIRGDRGRNELWEGFLKEVIFKLEL